MAVEEALYDTPLLARCVGLDLGVEVVPDERTILRLRHLLEQHGLSARMLKTVNRILTERGRMRKSGAIVDATLIAAPSLTNNARGERDLEMVSVEASEPRTTQKGNQWHFVRCAHPACGGAVG